MPTIVESIASVNPPFRRTQTELADFMGRVEGFSPPIRDRIAKIYAHSGIDYRYSCLVDYGADPQGFEFYPRNWQFSPAPTTGDRLEHYKFSALKLAIAAAEKAVERSHLSASSWNCSPAQSGSSSCATVSATITHLIVVSCTGFSAPGLDIQLIQSLGLSVTIDRIMIGFMGCQAALNGLKTADAICRSDTQARVLLVCVELCSLHFQLQDSLESVIVNAIFGDGAAAAIISSQPTDLAQGKLAYVGGHSLLVEDTVDLMTWTIGNTGFLMGLSPKIPQAIAQSLPLYLTGLGERYGCKSLPDYLDFWAVHPGGRQILDQVRSLMKLCDESIGESYAVLRQYGNMSSPTILFILERLWQRHHGARQQGHDGFEQGIALAFGPGLTLEGCLFRRV